jgi:hypothetical protein
VAEDEVSSNKAKHQTKSKAPVRPKSAAEAVAERAVDAVVSSNKATTRT